MDRTKLTQAYEQWLLGRGIDSSQQLVREAIKLAFMEGAQAQERELRSQPVRLVNEWWIETDGNGRDYVFNITHTGEVGTIGPIAGDDRNMVRDLVLLHNGSLR